MFVDAVPRAHNEATVGDIVKVFKDLGVPEEKLFVPNFAIIEPVIHYYTCCLESDENSTSFSPQRDLGNGRRSAVLLVASSRQSSNAGYSGL